MKLNSFIILLEYAYLTADLKEMQVFVFLLPDFRQNAIYYPHIWR